MNILKRQLIAKLDSQALCELGLHIILKSKMTTNLTPLMSKMFEDTQIESCRLFAYVLMAPKMKEKDIKDICYRIHYNQFKSIEVFLRNEEADRDLIQIIKKMGSDKIRAKMSNL